MTRIKHLIELDDEANVGVVGGSGALLMNIEATLSQEPLCG